MFGVMALENATSLLAITLLYCRVGAIESIKASETISKLIESEISSFKCYILQVL
jgi:hypothetical protein